MLHPSYSDLMSVVNKEVEEGETPVVNSRYSIVMAASKRARQIIGGEEPLVKNRNGNPLMVMSSAARNALTFEQENIISTYNKIISTDLKTIETNGGGSARCMLAEIFY